MDKFSSEDLKAALACQNMHAGHFFDWLPLLILSNQKSMAA